MPDVTFASDFIVGFPTETESEYLETEKFISDVGFTHLHIFPYSKRAGTPAAEMDGQVPDAVRVERASRLDAKRREIAYKLAEKYIGVQKEVLFELCEDGRATGHTPEFLEVAVITDKDLHNEVRTVKINGYDGSVFTGFIV